jgi:hypothetical protein
MAQDPSQREALRHFTEAVIAFGAAPHDLNLERYLAASRALEESRRRPIRPSAGRRLRSAR